jgi:hypothetical protein
MARAASGTGVESLVPLNRAVQPTGHQIRCKREALERLPNKRLHPTRVSRSRYLCLKPPILRNKTDELTVLEHQPFSFSKFVS